MGWDVTDQGLRVVFSRNIPAIVRKGMRKVVDDFLESQEIGIEEVAEFLCHPGGAKVLNSIESALDLPRGHLRNSRGVLCNCGNMSAATMHK
jgi:alkylresorcinol/alkylpyrone synthase